MTTSRSARSIEDARVRRVMTMLDRLSQRIAMVRMARKRRDTTGDARARETMILDLLLLKIAMMRMVRGGGGIIGDERATEMMTPALLCLRIATTRTVIVRRDITDVMVAKPMDLRNDMQDPPQPRSQATFTIVIESLRSIDLSEIAISSMMPRPLPLHQPDMTSRLARHRRKKKRSQEVFLASLEAGSPLKACKKPAASRNPKTRAIRTSWTTTGNTGKRNIAAQHMALMTMMPVRPHRATVGTKAEAETT
jgi:hypothetical protein